MICPNCTTDNKAGRRFCVECGAPLAAACPSCGAAVEPGEKFCGNCGTPLTGEGATSPDVAVRPAQGQPTAAEPVTERRLVTVLFADLVGFTPFAEERDPEEVRETLTRYFTVAREVIERAGGTVEKFIGDAVMAVWGAPVARENDAELAVRAAIELVAAVKALGPSIQARAGVLTGEAAVTIGAVGEGMVAGDLVNTASRLQSVAPAGAVLVGESTERAANRAVVFESAGPQLLKGKNAPVPAFRALRVVAEAGGRNRSETLEAPFVGRDEEFRLLKDLFLATSRDRRPRLVSVMGPAGIGKSRLAWEFLKYLDGIVEDTYWHAGRSPSYGEGITFWALAEMVRRRAGLLETDDEPTTRAKIAESTARWVPEESERRWVESALLALLGLGEPLPGGRDELFAAWRTFFERIAEHGTTVLAFEDLQWADAGVLDFIDHLLEWTKSLPIFVLTLSRLELLDRRSDWGAGQRNFVSLALDPLPEAAMRELLAGLVPGLPESVARSIVARADGIPLYAVETVRMLVADGRLREEGGAYHPVGELQTLAVPETLAALIAARLDGLGATERSVLQDAAVLGQSFTIAALAAVSGTEAEALEPLLRTLVRREILSINADPRSPERGQYTFVQALIREVAYNQLARAERKARHLAAARWFEGLDEGELAGALAQHYLAAYRNTSSGPEADALAGQARITLKAAAERAAVLGSHAQGLAFLTQALEISGEPAERMVLLQRAGEAALDAAIADVARRHLDEALSLARQLDDRLGVARAATAISLLVQQNLRAAEAIPILEAAAAEAAGLEHEPDVVRMLAELARAYAITGDPRALEAADRVLALAESIDLPPIVAEALINRALVLYDSLGRFHEPAAILRGVLPIVEAHGLTRAHMRALNNLAAILQDDDLRESQSLVERAIEIARRAGNLGLLTVFQADLAGFRHQLGDWTGTEEMLEELGQNQLPGGAVLGFLEVKASYQAYRGDPAVSTTMAEIRPRIEAATHAQVTGYGRLLEAQVAVLEGRLSDAYRLASEGLAMSSRWAPYCAEWAARAALWMGDARGARTAVEGFDAHRPHHGRLLQAIERQLHGGLDAVEGRRSESIAGYGDALARLRELEATVQLGLCLVDFALLVPPAEPEAAAAAEEARDLWSRLGSPPMLARLGAGLARWEVPASARSTGRDGAIEPPARAVAQP